jgi:hypothetical protein
MNSNQEISECIKIASTLDNLGYFKLADSLTNISYRLAQEKEEDKTEELSENFDKILVIFKNKAIEAKSLILSNLSSESLTPANDKDIFLKIDQDGNYTFFEKNNNQINNGISKHKSNYNVYLLINKITNTNKKTELISYAKKISEIYFKRLSELFREKSKAVSAFNELSDASWILGYFAEKFSSNNLEEPNDYQQKEKKKQITYNQAIINLKKEYKDLETYEVEKRILNKKVLNKTILDIKNLCLEISDKIEQNSETQEDSKLYTMMKNIATNKLTYQQYFTNFLSIYDYLNQGQINLNDPDISTKIQQLKNILIIPKYIYTKLQNEMKNNPT